LLLLLLLPLTNLPPCLFSSPGSSPLLLASQLQLRFQGGRDDVEVESASASAWRLG
ncbi:hypothetical protein LINPERPRIM_LOCUS29261, partial [Linum perenne]